jgi:hypothetical protein
MFVDELRSLVAQLATKDLPAVVNVGVDGSLPSDVDVIATPLGGMKSSCLETLVSELGRWLPMGGGACLMEVLRRLAMEFLAKMRAEVDRVIIFGLGLKIKASRDLRKKMARVFSRLGLKLKLILRRWNLKRKSYGCMADSWVKPNDDLGLGKTPTEKALEVCAIEAVAGSDLAVSAAQLSSATRHLSPEMGMLRRGFLLRQSLGEDKKRQRSLVGIDVGSDLLGSIQIAPATNRMSPKVSLLSLEPIQFAPVGVDVGSDLVGLAEIALESPETNRTSPDVPSTNLAALEVSPISSVTINAVSV